MNKYNPQSLLRKAKIDVLIAMNESASTHFFCAINAYRARLILKKLGHTAVDNKLLIEAFRNQKFIDVLSTNELLELVEQHKDLINKKIEQRLAFHKNKELDEKRQQLHKMRIKMLGYEKAEKFIELENNKLLQQQENELELKQEEERIQQEYEEMRKHQEFIKEHADEISALRERQEQRKLKNFNPRTSAVDVKNDLVDEEILNIFNQI